MKVTDFIGKTLVLVVALFCLVAQTYAREYHVKVTGNDINSGTLNSPLRTINAAAQKALSGDTITVHAGVYREWINPLNGGRNKDERILYRAAEGEKVEIKGSELVTDWIKERQMPGVWKVVLPNSFFGSYNPYIEKLGGDWFYNHGRVHHTGDVYLNDVSLYEVDTKEKVYSDTIYSKRDPQGSCYLWHAVVDEANTTIYANFGKLNPNKETVEIAVRPTCFYPTREGLNYITIRGFRISQAATQWAAPTAEQIGMVATNWNKGWIIENNVIKNSRCNGISLGKERSTGHNLASIDSRLDGTAHYREVIFNTLRHGWNRENIGSHIVRNNIISDCEQTGICGSMGAAFSEIYGNHIYNIWVKGQFSGQEMAGIKFHGAIDTHIHHNRIHDGGNYGMWLDWMTQGTRVSSNLLYRNGNADLFFEVNHGPYMVDNNILLSDFAIYDFSDGGAYVYNLVNGFTAVEFDDRYTPYQLEHSTEIKGVSNITNGDNRFYNNIFIGKSDSKREYGICMYDSVKSPIYAEGNFFCNGAEAVKGKNQGIVNASFNPCLVLVERGNEVYLSWKFDMHVLSNLSLRPVTAHRLGRVRLSTYAYESPDGTPLNIDCDYWGNKRDENSPMVGPFEKEIGAEFLKVW